MKLTESNYFSQEAEKEYCGSTQYKNFIGMPLRPGCEERALKTISGEYIPETTKALLEGSILDALWENDDPEYILERFPDCVSSRGATKGQLKSEYQKVIDMYQRTLREEKFCAYMSGDKQTIMAGEIEGLPFKIKIDSYLEGKAIVDLKTTQTLDRNFRYYIPDSGERLPFYLAYGYDIQLAIYREIVRQNTGDNLLCYLACIDKKPHPMCDIIELPQKLLDDALERIKGNCETIIMLKNGEIEPSRCENSECDYCRDTHVCTVISTEEFELNENGRRCMITKYTDYCLICGKPNPEEHHLVFGISKRALADADSLTIPLCNEHHEQMHNHDGMMAMSRLCGQLFYERNMCAAGMTPDEARDSFRRRYGISYM